MNELTLHPLESTFRFINVRPSIQGFFVGCYKNYFRSSFRLHSKSRLLAVKRFLSLLMDFLLKIFMRGNPLTLKGLSFQMLSFLCQSISFDLEIKCFIVQKKYNFKDKRKQIVWYYLSKIYTSPTLTNFNIKSIIINTIVTIQLRF